MSRPDGRASAAEIAAEIARTRDRLSRGLAALDRDYALRHLAVRATRMARKPGLEAGKLGEALQRDALPLAAIALSLGWLGLSESAAGRSLMQRLAGTLAALQQIGRDFGFGAAAAEATPPPPPPLSGDFSP